MRGSDGGGRGGNRSGGDSKQSGEGYSRTITHRFLVIIQL